MIGTRTFEVSKKVRLMVTQWAHAAKQVLAGGVSLEHDLYEKTVNAAFRALLIPHKEYTLLPVGVEVYKNNSTANIALFFFPSSGVACETAAVVLDSPVTYSPVSMVPVAANIATSSGSSLVASTAFGFAATMAVLSFV